MTDTPRACQSCLSRRTLLLGVGGIAGGTVLAASEAEAALGGTWETLGRASAVPIGSGRYYTLHGGAARYVVTQPRAGVFRAFDGHCTHEGGETNQFPDRFIQCSGHGSRFRIANGEVVRGPAALPLRRVEVRVRRGKVQVR